MLALVMRTLLMTLLLWLAGIGAAQAAAFISNRADWMMLSLDQRQTYVRGVLDARFIHYVDDTQDETAMKEAVPKCLVDLQVSSWDLSDLVTRRYNDDLATWRLPPAIVLVQQVAKLCPR